MFILCYNEIKIMKLRTTYYPQTMPNITTIKSNDGSFSWINIVNAAKKEIDYLKRKYKFEPADLGDSYAKKYAQRPKFNIRNDYCFLILQFPVYNKKTRIIHAEEIDFFISGGYIITVHKNNLSPLVELFNDCAKDKFYRGQYMADGNENLLYEIIIRLEEYCYPILDHISEDIKKIEENIFASSAKELIREIMRIKRNIFDVKKILEAHKNAIQKIANNKIKFLSLSGSKSYYHELIDHTKNIWEIIQGQKELIESLEDTNTTLVSFRLSGIMKTLTIFSVILLPLTLISSIFGMNTTNMMPFINSHYGFWLIIIIMMITSLIMFLFFKRKKWL